MLVRDAAAPGHQRDSLCQHRKSDTEFRSFARRAFNVNGAAVVLNDPVDNRQSEAGAPGLCRKERIEYFIKIFMGDPQTRIRYTMISHHPVSSSRA